MARRRKRQLFDAITIPLWLAALLAVLAIVALADRVFAPSVKWYFRRKANRAISELNTRLQLGIKPFATTKRKALIDQLLFDVDVIQAVEEHALENNIPRDVAMTKAERYAREIVPDFNAYAYSILGARFARFVSTFLYRVRLGYSNDEALAKVDPEATVVFVMNHRSNVDYLLVTYMVAKNAVLSYAVGEWARVWALQSIVRWMGAYFIRRDSGNMLYRRVLARYVHMATRSGVTQAMFPEGGLSRDGLLREPRFGLLSYMIAAFDETRDRDVVFVPVGVNYDRVMEDRILTRAKNAKIGEKTFQYGAGKAFGFLWHMLVLRFQGKLFRYGYACASFGEPVSLKGWLEKNKKSIARSSAEKRFALIESFGRDLMENVGEVVPVLPVALVSSVFESSGDEVMTELELKSRCFELMKVLEAKGAHIYIPRMDRDYAISAGLRMLTMRHMVLEEDGLFRTAPDERELIGYYVNSIRHLF